MTPAERKLRAQVAANTRWSRQDGRQQAAIARAGFDARFEREVDPDGVLSPAERERRAAAAKRAYMQRLALKSARARRSRAVRRIA